MEKPSIEESTSECARRYLARQGGSLHAITAVGVLAFSTAPAPTSSTATTRAWRNEIRDMALPYVKLCFLTRRYYDSVPGFCM
jgi:hypothetical protein